MNMLLYTDNSRRVSKSLPGKPMRLLSNRVIMMRIVSASGIFVNKLSISKEAKIMFLFFGH